MRLAPVYVAAALLVALGLGAAAWRHLDAGAPLTPGAETSVWNIEARIGVTPDPALPAKIDLLVPNAPPRFMLLGETRITAGYGVTESVQGANRVLTWTKRRSEGRDILYYRARLTHGDSPNGAVVAGDPPPAETPDYRASVEPTVEAFLDGVRRDSADIFSFAAVLLKRLQETDQGGELLALMRDAGGEDRRRAEAAATLLHGARIPARPVFGFMLSNGARSYDPQIMLQVHNGEGWAIFDPRSADRIAPEDFLIWARDAVDPLSAENVESADVAFSVLHAKRSAETIAETRQQQAHPILNGLSLSRLPVDMQKVYQVLLLLPVGAVLVVLLRNVVGVPTAGTFTPVLLALAFRQTDLAAGVGLSALVIAFGLAARLYLERLQLLFVPKIAAVLIAVILMMTLISLASAEVGFTGGLSVSLFPMVVLAWIIERLSVVWEENGPQDAMPQAFGTVIAASLAFLLLNLEQVQHLAFTFPELMLVLLGATLALGRYKGYRLLELWRFRALKGEAGS
ncbi:MAG: UUP1 family membrane protein [Marivibrio sp.]|uniref:UUP1 family membrane protein n=1 Tax=Marivibrio sp. TaxID=2039719 RepID=UPI0032EE7C36